MCKITLWKTATVYLQHTWHRRCFFLSLDGLINVNENITHFLEHRSLTISVQKYLKGKWIDTTDSKISHPNMPLMVSTGIANKQGSKNIYDRPL